MGPAATPPRSLPRKISHLIVTALATATLGALAWQGLTSTSQTAGNTIEAGTLSITDDNPNSEALFTVSNLQDGSTGAKCITVTNDGTIEYDTLMLSRTPADNISSQLAASTTWDVRRLQSAAVDTTGGDCTAFDASGATKVVVPIGGPAHGGASTDTELDALKTPGTAVSYKIGYSVDLDNEAQADSFGGVTFAWNATQSSSAPGGIDHWAAIPTVPAPVFLEIGTDGDAYFINMTSTALRKVDKTTKDVTTVATLGSSGSLQGLAIRGNDAYVSDYQDHVVYRIDLTNGNVTTFAGTGTNGSSGDGGPATSAHLNGPSGLTVDSTGNVYIRTVDGIRKVDTNGDISTFAAGPDLDNTFVIEALDDGRLLAAIPATNRVMQISTAGTVTPYAGNGNAGYTGDGGPATAAELNSPAGLTQDLAGNVYIADALNCSVRKVTPAGTISTIAGSGNGGSPYTCLDLGDGGAATDAVLAVPFDVAHHDGRLLAAQLLGASLRIIDL